MLKAENGPATTQNKDSHFVVFQGRTVDKNSDISGNAVKTPSRSGGLDLIKILCALAIVFHHFQQDTGVVFTSFNFYAGRIYFGYLVELFFVISGFLFVQSERRHKRSASRLERFVIRVERFWPVAVLSIVAYLALYVTIHLFTGRWIFGRSFDLPTIVKSIFLVFAGGVTLPEVHGINYPLWYLCVLILCYLWSYAFDYIAEKTRTPLWVLYAILCMAGIITYTLDTRLPLFVGITSSRGYAAYFAGALIALLPDKTRTSRAAVRASLCTLVVSSALWLMFGGSSWEWYIVCFGFSPSCLLFFSGCRTINGLLSTHGIATLGKASFDIYVWQIPCELAWLLLLTVTNQTPCITYGYMAVYGLCIYAVGVALHLWLELPLAQAVSKLHNKICSKLKTI